MTKRIEPDMEAGDSPVLQSKITISRAELRGVIEEELTFILHQFSSFPHEYEVDRIIARIALCGKQDRNCLGSR